VAVRAMTAALLLEASPEMILAEAARLQEDAV
jgi:hypothetical protein